jgi:PAS domain S-box-containing protein
LSRRARRTRLARSSVAELLVALSEGRPLRDALADALHDPSLEVAYWAESRGAWIDTAGHTVAEPRTTKTRVATTVERDGRPVAALLHDALLAEDPELVDTVARAAAIALDNERLQAELRAQFTLLETIVDTAPSLLVNVDAEGRILDFNKAVEQASGLQDRELRGRFFWDVFIDPDEREAMMARFEAAAPDFPPSEYENDFTNGRGERRVIAWKSAPVTDETGVVRSIVAGGLDITDRHRQAEELERERSFLNAIANNAPSLLCLIDDQGVVQDLATNIAFERLLGYESAQTGGHIFWERYVAPADVADARAEIERVIAGGEPRELDSRWVARTGRRIVVAWSCTPLPRLDERTIFLISGADITQRKKQEEEIRASRARIVQAEDAARRGLERNLHDGAQQRLVSLSLQLRLAEARLSIDPAEAGAIIARARDELTHALDELRELARGIHPAVLTDRGLAAAVDALVARAPLPVEVTHLPGRLPAEAEAAAYYVVSEALANVAKYAGATSARVSLARVDGKAVVEVADDGVGGADPARGSGLRGLADRVAALDGSLAVESPPGRGTVVRAEFPLQRRR